MNIVKMKDQYLEKKDAIKVMSAIISNGQFSMKDSFLVDDSRYEFVVLINNVLVARTEYDIRNNEIRIMFHFYTKQNMENLLKSFKKICAEPKKISNSPFWENKIVYFKTYHCFKITSKNIDRMYSIFNLMLTMEE